MTISLSNRQAKEADRVGGIELMIPWPAELGAAPGGLDVGDEIEASAAQRAHAEALVRDACQQRGLVPVHVRIAHMQRQSRPPAIYLAVTIIGRRWVHASTQRMGRIMYTGD